MALVIIVIGLLIGAALLAICIVDMLEERRDRRPDTKTDISKMNCDETGSRKEGD